MPEMIEVEIYRRALDELVGQRIERVELPDLDFVRPKGAGAGAVAELAGSAIARTDRIGKLLLVDLVDGELERTIGLRFGMTGRLVVDGVGAIDRLEYASARNEPEWDRVVFTTSEGSFSINDPRRLGNIDLDPEIGALGPDALGVDAELLAAAVAGRTTSIKALLLNQAVIAGLGNLLVDEILWRAALAPQRIAGELAAEEIERLADTIPATVLELLERGGSHTGDTFEHRTAGGRCPRDDAEMANARVGGRGTWWCPSHQV